MSLTYVTFSGMTIFSLISYFILFFCYKKCMAGAIFFILFLESFATVCNTFSIFFFQIYFIKRSFKLTTIFLFGLSVTPFSFCCQTDRQSTLLFGLLQFLFFSSVGCGLCVCVCMWVDEYCNCDVSICFVRM